MLLLSRVAGVIPSLFLLSCISMESVAVSKLEIFDEQNKVVSETIYSIDGCSFRSVVGGSHNKFSYELVKQNSGLYYKWNIGSVFGLPVLYIPKVFSGKETWSMDGSSFAVDSVSYVAKKNTAFVIYEVSNRSLSSDSMRYLFTDDGNYVGSRNPLTGKKYLADLSEAKRFYEDCNKKTKGL